MIFSISPGIERPFRGIEHVHPYQQKKARELVDHFSEDPDIRRVILFGPGVETNCTADSEVAILVESDSRENPLKKAFHFAIDCFRPEYLSDQLRKEISDKGVVIYERKPKSYEAYKDETFRKSPDVKAAYDALQPEFDNIQAMIDAENARNLTK